MFKLMLRVISLVFLPLLLNASIFNEAAIDKIGSKTYHELKIRYEQKNAYIMSKSNNLRTLQNSEAVSKLRIKAKKSTTLNLIIKVKELFYPGGLLTIKALEVQNQRLAQKRRDVINKLSMINPKYRNKVKEIDGFTLLIVTIDAVDLNKVLAIPEIQSVIEDYDVDGQLMESTSIIGADTAWGEGYSGAGQTIAVIDEGINTSHIFFTGKVVFEGCFSGGNGSAGYDSLCPNGDDNSTTNVAGSACADARDDCIHGTHVAGIAVGKDDTNHIYGVAKDASLIAIQTGSYYNNDVISRGGDQLSALRQVIALKDSYKIAAVNMSSGTGKYNSACDATSGYTELIDELKSYDIAFISTAGNNYYTDGIHSPACVSTAVAVGSTNDSTEYGIPQTDGSTIRIYPDDSQNSHTRCDTFSEPANGDSCLFNQYDKVSIFSNASIILDMLAPGAYISSANASDINGYKKKIGTSMAAPHVAGAFAVLKSANANLTTDEIEAMLKSTGKSITDDKNTTVIKPRIDIAKALDTALLNSNGIRVLVLGSQGVLHDTANADIKDYLLKTGRFKVVDTFDTDNATPTATLLKMYDAVLVYSYVAHKNADTLGDNLAAYVDAGGGVVTAMSSQDNNMKIKGKFNFYFISGIKSGNYWAIRPSDGNENGNVSMSILVANHPILEGVTSLSSSLIRPKNNVHTEAIRVANWSDGTPLIATREIEGVRRADIGFDPTNSSVTSSAGELTKDGDLVIANALEWVADQFNGALVPITSYLLLD